MSGTGHHSAKSEHPLNAYAGGHGETAPLVEEMLLTLEFWVREREAIRQRKEAGLPRPWTNDPWLRDYRWCNVRRMDDRVSRELMAQWYVDADPASQLVAATLARLVNWPEALMAATDGAGFRCDMLDRVHAALAARSRDGRKVFTGAYVVPGVPGMSKVDSVLALVRRVLSSAAQIMKPTLRETWSELTRMEMLGSFLAGQIVADLAHLGAGACWPDRVSWAPIGPGSARGMNRLRGRDYGRALGQARFDVELADLMEHLRPRIIEIHVDRDLGAADYQGLCCEFDKYQRLKKKQGTVRARYDGEAEAAQASLF